MRAPDLGLRFEPTSTEDREALEAIGVGVPPSSQGLTLFRLNGGEDTFLVGNGSEQIVLSADADQTLINRFPKPFKLNTDVPLPARLTLDSLLGKAIRPLANRERRTELIEFLEALPEDKTQGVTDNAGEIAGLIEREVPEETQRLYLDSMELGRELLCEVAKISVKAIEFLRDALREGDEGRASGLLEQMNRSLARHLNFNRWWTQDRDFALRLALREREIAFTISDKTGTDYSFSERSRGLSYFLSYYIQLRAHRLKRTEHPEILLMDEPDAYLSSTGQQDLLRALEDFARPDGKPSLDQVVYVTHSPFLINRNAGHRIRVLDKGSDEEGTRIVGDVARNHYEPLRSALGASVGESAFIGGANLIVEGLSDQVLLAGLTNYLRLKDVAPTELLNLNEVTVIPANSASNVPYMAYLARGRDELQPPCVALLDGDKPGRDAVAQLKRGPDGKQVLAERFVVDLGNWSDSTDLKLPTGLKVVELEDLIPVAVAAEAARRYALRFLGIPANEVGKLSDSAINEAIGPDRMWDSVEKAFEQAFGGAIAKVGFTKELVYLLEESPDQSELKSAVVDLGLNFERLLSHLARLLREARKVELERRVNRRTDRIVELYLRDHPDGSTRDEAREMFAEVIAGLEDSYGDDAVRRHLLGLQQEFELDKDPLESVTDFGRFCELLEDIPAVRKEAFQEAAQAKPLRPKKPRKPRQRRTANKSAASAESSDGKSAGEQLQGAKAPVSEQ